MKPGSGDPFAEEEPEESEDLEEDEDEEHEQVDSQGTVEERVSDQEQETTADTGLAGGSSERTEEVEPSTTLPYKYRRDNIQDGRDRDNLLLRPIAQDHIDDLIDEMDAVFESEDVYKFDVLEAALLAAGKPDRTVEDELRSMGYGMV